MRYKNDRPTLLAMALATACSGWAGASWAGRILLADNSQVLQGWQQAQGGAAPQLVEQAGGGTTIQWQGGISLDVYRNDSSGGSGSSTTTPLRDGNFYKLQAQGDLRETDPAGAVSYLQFSASHTDDRGVISHAPGGQLNSLQMGRAGEGYLVALGDVAANFSSLGTNIGLRGIMGQRLIGQTLLSATAGIQSESWEALADVIDRTTYLRRVYAAKVETPLAEGGKLYATVQGYDDDAGSLSSGGTTLAPATSRSVTAGFAYQAGRFNVQGEAGASRWQEDGQGKKNDRAVIVDAGWTFESASLRAGYHDIGKHYASLSAQGGNGIREAYLNGNWAAANWLNLNADLRHSENDLAATPPPTIPPTPATANAAENDALAVTAAITFGPEHPAWSLLLSHTLSDGENGDGSGNRNQGYGATVSYGGQNWNSSLAYNLTEVENGGAAASNGETGAWVWSLGRSWIGEAWSLGLNFAASLQEQELDTGNGPRTTTWQLGLTGQYTGWGSLTASYLHGDTEQSGSGTLEQRGWQLEASHPFKGQNAVKFYYRDNQVTGSTATPSADYNEQTVGLQLVYTL